MDASNSQTTSPVPSPPRRSARIEANNDTAIAPPHAPARPSCTVRFNSIPEIFEIPNEKNRTPDALMTSSPLDRQLASERERLATRPSLSANSSLAYRLSAACVVLAIFIPLIHGYPWSDHISTPILGVKGTPVKRAGSLLSRDNSPTDVCARWAHMTALVNGTLYIYGGQATQDHDQKENTWNNNFLTLDLTKNFDIGSPPLVGLPQPNGPPAVALGSLWHSYDSLYLYGGEYSDHPVSQPSGPFSIWEYDIAGSSWKDHTDPETSAGKSSDSGDGTAVQPSAEGAGISVPLIGRSWYFGGHQDYLTTFGWSNQVARVYLTSLLEYTLPGSTNSQVNSLSSGQAAGVDGAWRNITDDIGPGFPERADGSLVYVPGYGAEGILVGMAGGTNQTYQQMSQVDVYDIATSSWFKQACDGPVPTMRVNPCTVVASAPDGSSQNIYMWAGQNLIPADNQTQYNDMWILTLPSFTWIQVDQTNQPVPLPRAGHTCNIWNAQMVVVGGYTGASNATCDSPGVYVYDLSNLAWRTSYAALSSSDPDASTSANPLNQQLNQRSSGGASNAANNAGPGGLEGSYGYSVPPAVQSVIGGGPQGGATVTQPARLPTSGPMKTGKPVTYTVTATGAAVTTTAQPAPGAAAPNTAAIAAGVCAGVLAIAAAYLAFCASVYRRRMKAYKRHVAMASRLSYEAGDDMPVFGGQHGYYGKHDESGLGSSDRSNKGDNEGSAFIAGSGRGSNSGGEGRSSGSGSGGNSAVNGRPGPGAGGHRQGSVEDLLGGGEPSFWGTMLSPRRSLRVTNRD